MAEQPVHHQQQHGSGLGGSQFGDTTLTKIFVGGLAWETQRDTMRAYFEQFGDILEAVVITDKNTGRSKGYGFVTFKDPESARRACENPTPVIDGRRANCNLAALGVRPRFPGFQGPRLRHFAPIIGSAQIPSSSSQQQQQPQQHQQQQQQQQVPFAYHQAAAAGFSYAPYGYTYVHEYPYPSLYNPYGNPQLSAAVYGGGGANSGGGGAAGGGLTSPGSGAAGGSGAGAMYTYSTAGFNPAAAAAAAAAAAGAAVTYPMSSPSYPVPQLLQYPPSSAYVPTMLPLQHQTSASSPQPQSQQQPSLASPSSSSSQQASNAPAGLTVMPSTTSTMASTTASTTMATTTTTTS